MHIFGRRDKSVNLSVIINILNAYEWIKDTFLDNCKRKNWFLAACHALNSDADLHKINKDYEYGGLIGYGDSLLDLILSDVKVLRMHAVLHDASGCVKTLYNEGPGYCYMLPNWPNSCFIGHVTGVIFCVYLKLVEKQTYEKFNC